MPPDSRNIGATENAVTPALEWLAAQRAQSTAGFKELQSTGSANGGMPTRLQDSLGGRVHANLASSISLQLQLPQQLGGLFLELQLFAGGTTLMAFEKAFYALKPQICSAILLGSRMKLRICEQHPTIVNDALKVNEQNATLASKVAVMTQGL